MSKPKTFKALKVGVRGDLERAPDPGLLCLLTSLTE